jgi:hypothetical protein
VWCRECTGRAFGRARNRTKTAPFSRRIYNVKNAIAILMFIACAGAQQPADQPWQIEMTSSGGIAGKGAGSMRIDSDGKTSCRRELTDAERRRLDDAVANAKPDGWKTVNAEGICCDRIEWTLALTIGGKTHKVTWIDDPKFAMPDDLRALTTELSKIQSSHECGSR